MPIKILLIEDNLGDSRLLEELLNTAYPRKYQINSACTLSDGLNCLGAEEFNVVMTDLTLPDSNGIQAVLKIQEHTQSIPIIVLSGLDNNELALQIVKLGAQDFLIKGQGDGYLIGRAIDYAIERKLHEQKLNYLASYDSLTGLANRTLFWDRLGRALIRAKRNKTLVALLVIDLDRFKTINDTLGHNVGDELLVQVAHRFEHSVRDGDTIARLGGDEFAIIIEDVVVHTDVEKVADKILNIMKSPFGLTTQEVYASSSIGVSLYPTDELKAEELLKYADAAMYCAKKSGQNSYRFYAADINQNLLTELDLEAKLRRAVIKQDFMLYYQPKFNIVTQELIGAEALMRWNHAKDGMISPVVFIPLAEKLGLIDVITDWVIKEACKQNRLWQLEGYQPIRVAINVSPKQFNQKGIAKRILDQIVASNLSPEYVELEITEGALMKDAIKSNEVLNELKNKGIQISIDDFGTGYSSLSYLQKLDLDILKIDQSFVKDILDDADDAEIVSAIIAMAKSLKLDVIAEGVETQAQKNCLVAKGCINAQGYLFGKPVPAEEFPQFFVKKHRCQDKEFVVQF